MREKVTNCHSWSWLPFTGSFGSRIWGRKVGIWAVPAFRTVYGVANAASLCLIVCSVVYLVVPRRRWMGWTFLASFTFAAVAISSFLSAKFYHENIDTKTMFMAQCRMGSGETTCLAACHQFYPEAA